MRSTRLLFLLIITQCYLIFTKANINSLEGTVYDSPNHRLSRDVNALSQSDEWISNDGTRFIRDTSEFTLTDKDDLSGLSASELESRLNRAQTNLKGKEAEEKRIKGELENARKASQAANTTLTTADGDWKAALTEKERLEVPLKKLREDVNEKEEKLNNMKDLLTESEEKISFPPNAQDKKAFAMNASNIAQQTLSIIKSRITELNEKILQIKTERNNLNAAKKPIEERLASFRNRYIQDGCSDQNADKKAEAANKRSKRKADCSETLKTVNNIQAELTQNNQSLTNANAELKAANRELGEKQDAETAPGRELKTMLDYVNALNNVTLAAQELKDAQNLLDEPKELKDAKDKEIQLHEALSTHKKTVSRLAASYTTLEGHLKTAKTNAESAKSIRDHYQSKYDEQTTPTPVVTAGPPFGLIVGCIVGALAVAAGAGAALYFLWWKKRKTTGKKEITKDDEDDDSDGSKEGGKKDKVKAKKSEKTKSDKTKSDEAQKSDEKKDEKEKVKPELPEKSKPDDPGVKLACGMKSHGKADEEITKTLRERKIDNEYTSNGLEAEEPIVTEKKAFTKTDELLGNPQDDDATMDAGLEWEQLAKYVAKSQSKMDPAEIHRQVLHFLGSMDFHKINDLISRNKDYRIPSIELDAKGQMGYTITGRCDTIKSEDDMEGYHNHHANEKSQFKDGMLIRGY